MPRKIFGFVLKAIWIIIALLIPTIMLFVSHNFLYDNQVNSIYNHILYITAILLIVIGICIALFIWKKPYALFALSLGFLITLVSYPIVAWFLGGTYWREAYHPEFGGINFSIVIRGAIYSVPFAILSFIPAIPATVRWSRRRKLRQPVISNKSVDYTESEASNDTEK